MAKKHEEHDHEEHIDETWLIPYADLLTLLLALFVVLFAMSSLDAKKFEVVARSFQSAFSGGTGVMDNVSALPAPVPVDEKSKKMPEKDKNKQSIAEQKKQDQIKKETKELEELKKAIDKYIKEHGLATQLETKLDNEMLKLTIRDRALFDQGSASVKPESQKLAIYIADILAQHLKYEVVVAGHTDNSPMSSAEFRSNWELSAGRSLNFMQFLLKSNKDIRPERFSSVGFGEYRPIAENKTVAGMAKNRRVEVSIIRTIKQTEDAVVK